MTTTAQNVSNPLTPPLMSRANGAMASSLRRYRSKLNPFNSASGLFSFGFIVGGTTMILFAISSPGDLANSRSYLTRRKPLTNSLNQSLDLHAIHEDRNGQCYSMPCAVFHLFCVALLTQFNGRTDDTKLVPVVSANIAFILTRSHLTLALYFPLPSFPPSVSSGLSFESCSLLFSWGLTVERMTIRRFSMSNQNGAPNEMASEVSNHPNQCE